MTRPRYNRIMPFELVFLGTGTSAGIPMIGCDCAVCNSTDSRDRRDRASVLIRYPDPKLTAEVSSAAEAFNPRQAGHRQLLIDTSPELRQQAIRERLSRIDGVLYTHAHADHIFGLDDLRRFNAVMKEPIDIHAETKTIETLQSMFRYIFNSANNVNPSFVATLIAHRIEAGVAFNLFGATWTPIRLLHGRLPIVGFRIDFADRSIAYCTDVSSIPPESFGLLADLDILVLDGLRYRHHPTHLKIDQAIEHIDRIGSARSFLTHMAHDVSHAELSAKLPDGVELAYDGLSVTLDAKPQAVDL